MEHAGGAEIRPIFDALLSRIANMHQRVGHEFLPIWNLDIARAALVPVSAIG